MITVEQIEPANEVSLPGRMLEPTELPMHATYYPLGFPAEVRTNSEQILEQFQALWGMFEKLRSGEPIQCEVQLVDGTSESCPPAPTYRLMLPLLISVANVDNYCVVDLERSHARIAVSQAALRHPLFVRYFLLAVPSCCIATRYATPVHSACVSLNGRGMLLCGDSGAGKSTLAYACARSGFTYVSDDGAYILDGGKDRMVTGNSHQVRFRPAAAAIFPELSGYEITPRAAGKPSIELPTAPIALLSSSQTAHVDFVIFLNRNMAGSPQLVPFDRELARNSMRHVLYGTKESLAMQYSAIDKVLAASVYELQYNDLDWAVDRLQALVATGR